MVTKSKHLKWYPWLNKPYRNFIIKYNQKILHHAIMINSPHNMGVNSLIWGISRWILCLNRINFKSCNKCHGCMLMNSCNHPDWYFFPSVKETKKIKLNEILYMTKNIMLTSNQSGTKIIYISNSKLLTQSLESCLLKILEEPPKNTFFIVRTHKLDDISSTFKSRFILWNIKVPNINDSFYWLKKQVNCSDLMAKTALNICDNIPISSKKILNESIWSLRIKLLKKLGKAIKTNNLFPLLSILNQDKAELLINWIFLLLIDAIKYKYQIKKYLTNIDFIKMIKEISEKFSHKCLEKSIQSWIQCKDKITNIPEINIQLILLEQLLRWEKILKLNV